MEKYVRVYNPVTIVGVKYMEHVCSPDVSYKVPAFARVYNLPENLLPFYNAVKTDPNIDSGHVRMIDWEKIMNMEFAPYSSYPTNCSAYSNYFIESDSNPRKWDNDIVLDLLLVYNIEENPNISIYLKAGLAGKNEHIPYAIFTKLGTLMQLAEQYNRHWIKPASSDEQIPDDIRDGYNETINGISYYVTNGKLFISKYGDRVSKCTNIIDTLKKQIEEASKYVKE